jgi:hypothetical protein
MLAITETLASERGLDWSFCDTDSMAFAKPSGLAADEFARQVAGVVSWFEGLNPYEFGGSILKVEDVNLSLENGEPEPLYCWAISSKRYALFNLGPDRAPIMRKVSAHGLGHLLAPYGSDNPAIGVPEHDLSVLEKGIAHWHVDLWWRIVDEALAGRPNRVRLDYHPTFAAPAMSRYGATSPELLRWFSTYNTTRPTSRGQVKPFGFLLSMSPKMAVSDEQIIVDAARPRRRQVASPKPIAPFDGDLAKAASEAFDRDSGERVPASIIKTYAEALAQYHIQPESKFLNGKYVNCGTTRRRHIRQTATHHIGKESNDWERQAVLGLTAGSRIDYGIADAERAHSHRKLATLIGRIGSVKAAKALDTTPGRLRVFTRRIHSRNAHLFERSLAARLPSAVRLLERVDQDRTAELDPLRQTVATQGLRATARRLGLDASNLRRKLKRNVDASPR